MKRPMKRPMKPRINTPKKTSQGRLCGPLLLCTYEDTSSMWQKAGNIPPTAFVRFAYARVHCLHRLSNKQKLTACRV